MSVQFSCRARRGEAKTAGSRGRGTREGLCLERRRPKNVHPTLVILPPGNSQWLWEGGITRLQTVHVCVTRNVCGCVWISILRSAGWYFRVHALLWVFRRKSVSQATG